MPAIQQLYQTLTQGLQQQNTQQLNQGVTGIVEDASRRGVLRSTLPVDARTSLTASLGQALAEGMGKLNLAQLQEVGGIQQQVGGLRTQRAGQIADLARALEAQDLERQKLEMQRIESERNYALQQQQLASSRSSGGGGGGGRAPTAAQMTQQAASALAQELRGVAGKDGYVSPQSYAAARQEWIGAGFSSKVFEDYFAGFKNPKNKNYKYY